MIRTKTVSREAIRAVVLAALMVLSVVGGTVAVAGTAAADSGTTSNATAAQDTPTPQNGSAKAMTISWFRDDGDANGPYPVPPNEYDGNESPGIQMFANAKGDAQIRIDNSTARNPNGKWDMLTLNLETTGLEELEPPQDGGDQGLVTENFIDNENWNVEITQVSGDKTLDVAANQEGYEPAEVERGSGDIPPVMIFADTEEIMTDYLMDGDPETSLYVWVDPNRAVLDENGEEASFEPGETYEATFTVHGQTETVTFEMVEGASVSAENLEAANSGSSEVTVETPLAGGTEVEMVLQTADGENQTLETEVQGNRVLGDAENPGTVPRGTVSGTFDLTEREGESFTVYVYMKGEERDGDLDTLVGSVEGTVVDVIDPNYTISNATIRAAKPMTIAYTNPDHDTPQGIGTQIGDGHASGDRTIAKNVNVDQPYFDEMWLHYETSTEVFAAIDRSPGSDQVEKFLNSPLSLEVRQTNADGEPKVLDLEQNSSGVYVVQDNASSDPRIYNSSEQTGLFFSFKLNEMQFFQGGEPVEPEVGDEFEATLTIDTEAGVREETITFEFVEGQTVIQRSGDGIELTQSENQEITANSTMARGTAMALRLVAESQNYSEQTGEITLNGQGGVICCDGPGTQPWGTLSAAFDTTSLPIGTEVTVQALIVADLPGEYPDNLVVDEVQGEIVEPPSANISISAQSGSGQNVTVDSVDFSDGGFVAVRTGSVSGPTIGSTELLESGEHSEVEISLSEPLEEDTTVYVVAHQDTNANEAFDFPLADDPYQGDDGAVSGSAEYTVEAQETPTSTETATATPTDDTPTATPTDDTVPDTPGGDDMTGTTATGGQPGFGFVPALVALLCAGLVLYRRD